MSFGKDSSFEFVMQDGKLVNVGRADITIDKQPLDSVEEEVWRIFNEHQQLKTEIGDVKQKYQEYTTGKAKHYHDIWCSADRRKPMGCECCSCTIGKEIKNLRFENARLKEALSALNELYRMKCRGERYSYKEVIRVRNLVDEALKRDTDEASNN